MFASRSAARRIVERALNEADVQLNGTRHWDITVHDDRFFERVLTHGSLGAGESYMDQWWDCDRIDDMAYRVLRHGFANNIGSPFRKFLATAQVLFRDLQKGQGARRVAQIHYDLPVSLFEAMLGTTMNYSCGYWREAGDLTAAQMSKMELICRKLGLKHGMRLLDIGCGWGGLAHYAATRYSSRVVGITVSDVQANYAVAKCRDLPVTIHCLDYRDASQNEFGTFDAITSVGMLEHVGPKNYAKFFGVAANLLGPDGLLLVQTFGRERSEPIDPWINRYIFPNSYVPSARELCDATNGLFVTEDWHNFGADYDRTLLAWEENFERWAEHTWKRTDPRAYRMWRYYLLTFAAGFRVRDRAQLWQLILAPRGVPGGYRSIR